jgi:hypothetical protein
VSGLTTVRNRPVELAFAAQHEPAAPGEVEVDVTVQGPGGRLTVPAFWAGGREWRARLSLSEPGDHRFEVRDSAGDLGLEPQGGELTVEPGEPSNPLFAHGAPTVAPDGRKFAHADGTPFFWLADTWWNGLSGRVEQSDFETLLEDRVRKGFTAIQLVAGFYPDMPAFDERGDGRHGWPWTPEFADVNPAWWDDADERVQAIADAGLVPCVVGAWGYHLLWMGTERAKRHWRYLIARWSALPVVWCVAGEARLPYYPQIGTEEGERHTEQLQASWLEVARTIRALDPHGRLITVHPGPADGSFASSDVFPDGADAYDFSMLQTGHNDMHSYPLSLETLHRELGQTPRKPLINSEVCYEGIMGASNAHTQRFLFWTNVLGGAAGHTYGAQGIWNWDRGQDVGDTGRWGTCTWEEAYRFPGSQQLGWAAGFLRDLGWERLEPHPEHVHPHWTVADPIAPYAAAVPGELIVAYFPSAAVLPWTEGPPFMAAAVHGLEPGASYAATFVDPSTGREEPRVDFTADADGSWALPSGALSVLPSMDDWVVVVRRSPDA